MAGAVLRGSGVLLVVIMVAGRAGRSCPAGLGSRKMREEIEALRTMGFDPIEVLILPRMLALIIALPILAFLGAMAAPRPPQCFWVVQGAAGRWRRATRKIGEPRLTNARILRMEILHSLQHLLPRESVTVFHLLFPDPWPKRRHRSRRVFSEGFLRAAALNDEREA